MSVYLILNALGRVTTASFSLAADLGNDGAIFDWSGYIRGTTGSVTPTGVGALPGGVNFDSLVDFFGFGGGGYAFSQISMSGFSADPGKTGFWTNVDIESDTGQKNFTSASADGNAGSPPAYSYSSGTATWTWSAATGGTGFDLNGVADPHDIVFHF